MQKRGCCKEFQAAAAQPWMLDVRKSGTGLPDERKKKMERRIRRHKPNPFCSLRATMDRCGVLDPFFYQHTRETLKIPKKSKVFPA